MGLKSANNGLVPCRFLCMSAHLVVLISIFIRKNDHLEACDKNVYPDTNNMNIQLIFALSLSITLLLIELISFMIGITLFNSFQLAFSTIFHSSGAISLSFMIFDVWCSIDFWPIFATCSVLPVFIEFIYIIGVWLFKRPIS